MKNRWLKIIILSMVLIFALALTACQLEEPSTSVLYHINDNASNQLNKDKTTKDEAIDKVTDSITNLRSYLDNESIATTGYYMGMEFNVDTIDPVTSEGGNFRLKIQAHLYTYKYIDDDGNPIWKYYDKKDGKYYDTNNAEGTRVLTSAESIHNEVIKKSNILIEWYNGTTNQMLIGMYFDGINNNSDDPGNVLYLNIQGAKRSFPEFGDTVLYQQLIRLLMSLSVEKLLTAGNIQDDAGVSTLHTLFNVAVNENYKVVLNSPITSILFYSIAADAIASNLTNFIQGIFAPFEDKLDPLTLKYLGFDFSVMGRAIINSVNSDMQFFTEPDPSNVKEIMTGAYLTFAGAALSKGSIYNYVSDVTFEYGAYPPKGMELDKLYYQEYDYGKYEFVGNLYVPMLNANYDALIRTNVQQYDNSTNNVFMQFTDIANGELMIGAYYKNERSYLDISGLEHLYGWVDLNELGFPRVYDDSIDLADLLGKMFNFLNNGIVSIVDAILSPDKNDKKSKLLDYIMEKTVSTKKDPNDIFSKNTVTLTVDMYLIKHALEETGQGTYTTRQIINILDSLMPYTMDQIAIMLGVSSAEVMLDNTYFTFTLNVDTNEITIKMFTNVGIKPGQPSTLIFQLDVIPTHIGEYVEIAEINFDNFNPLEQIYTYSATMDGNFVFSTAETVDLSRLLSATIGENSGKNTEYILPQNAGITFRLIYDQFVTDQVVGGTLKKAGRSAFQLTIWITGSDESQVVIRLASDDVAFNNEVYQNQPERAKELGYVWVSIECVKLRDGITQKIPKVKVREDVFMTSMQAYMNGTKISDDASELEGTDINLSITSILFALIEDSYVVPQPKQLEITTSNETVQSIFRVKGLIGNIRVNAGFSYRVEGLEGIKNDYGMYKVGEMENMEGNSPYDTVLHDTIPVYFYDDYHEEYDDLDYDLRTDRKTGVIQVYEKGGKVYIYREQIYYSSDSFFNSEGENNQDISLIRFNYNVLSSFVHKDGEQYYYLDYENERIDIEQQYIKIESGIVYIYYLGLMERVHHEGGTKFYYYAKDKAITDKDGNYIYFEPKPNAFRDFLFNYDLPSIEITEAAKTQYAPRIEGSFMGTLRHYILVITSVLAVERGKLFELNSKEYYSADDEFNIIEIFDEDGVKVSETLSPIVLFVMEPCLPIPQTTAVNIKVGNNTEVYSLQSHFLIDHEKSYLKGHMEVTEVIIAEGTMGEATYPVRIIMTNREISAYDNEKVSIYTTENSIPTEMVPVVDAIEIDPYDYILAKYDYFSNIDNFNPDQYSFDANSPDYYITKFAEKEKEFINQYFSQFIFKIIFNHLESVLYLEEVKDKYIAKEYSNFSNNNLELFNWNFDVYVGSNYREDRITAEEGNTIYLHTYFEGQLIALKVAVGKRIFSHLKFYENDDFNPDGPDAILPNGKKVAGHYVANYFDESSYTIPTNPIFVFKNDKGVYYEKVFDFSYISGLSGDGNYIIENSFGLGWQYDKITNIGSLGSYYWENGEIVNRPFYISHVIKDENGIIIEEGTPTPGENANDTDIDSSSLNLFWLLKIFKPIRNNIGIYEGNSVEIPLIAGTQESNDFTTIPLFITVECPKLDVAYARTESGAPIEEADEMDTSGAGSNYVVFNPHAIKIGNNSMGYYLIDPLNADTNIIPRDITLYFVDPNDSEGPLSSHKFKNVEWYSYIPTIDDGSGNITYGEGSYLNNSGHQIIKKVGNNYIFDLPTNEPMVTRIMAKIGSELSGYQLIVLCIKVLSKDPQRVEFYSGSLGDTTKPIRGDNVERVNVAINYDGSIKKEEYAVYTYYVNTFANFVMPTWIEAYFGIDGERKEMYSVNWQTVSSEDTPIYRPNSVLCLMAVIGSGDVTIRIYLVVVVANYTISDISLVNDINAYYVKVNSHDNFVRINDLLHLDILNNKLGLYEIDGFVNNYILLSTGGNQDGTVELGKVGIYDFVDGQYVLRYQMYPYDFIENLYSNINVRFNNSQLVDYATVSQYYTYVFSSETGQAIPIKMDEVIKFNYIIDPSTMTNKLDIVYLYVDGDGFEYYLQLDANKKLTLYPNASMIENQRIVLEIHELNSLFVHENSATEIRDYFIESITTTSGTVLGNGKKLSEIYTFISGNLTYYSPQNITQELSFVSMTFVGGKTMIKEELDYRLSYLEKNRKQGAQVPSINNKKITINNFSNIFSINDIVREAVDKDGFVESNKYNISLGTGKSAYDISLRLIFDGGVRVSVDSMTSQTIDIEPYSVSGAANHGLSGYVLATNVSTNIKVITQDGTGAVNTYYYGDEYGANTEKLVVWYVSESTYDSLPIGSTISTIPQSIIYSTEGGSLTISTLTSQGFRITRVLNFSGVPDRVDSFNSIQTTGLLIRNGKITIEDIYNYMPVNTYFGGTAYLPKEITFALSGKPITIANINWSISNDWYNNVLSDLSYMGTDNNQRVLATAQILGWDSYENGVLVAKDRIQITLYITIDRAEIIQLPWKNTDARLDTLTINEEINGQTTKVHCVEVDAFNDSNSGAISNTTFVLPANLRTQYASSSIHTFRDVLYTFRGVPVTYIPYNNQGIDIQQISTVLGLNSNLFVKDHIDLQVNVGLGQVLTIRFRFYDKTVVNVSADISLTDDAIRNQIYSALDYLDTEVSKNLAQGFNLVRVQANIENLINNARIIRNNLVVPLSQDIMGYTSVAAINTALLQGFINLDLINNVGVYPTKQPYSAEQCYNYALSRIKTQAQNLSNAYAAEIMNVINTTSAVLRQAAVNKKIEDYIKAVFNGAYDKIINDYVKEELSLAFVAQLLRTDSYSLSYASYYKNYVEASFDIEKIIADIYKIRELKDTISLGVDISDTEYEDKVNQIVMLSVFEVIVQVLDNAMTTARSKLKQPAVSDVIDRIILIRLGIIDDSGSQYSAISNNIESFIVNDMYGNKVELRKILNKMIGDAMDFSIKYGNEDVISSELASLVPLLVQYNIDSITGFSNSMTSIRHNIISDIDISELLVNVFSRAIDWFVKNIYMEMHIATAIKRVQKINGESNTHGNGYYIIDPYYDYTIVPSTFIANFDEAKGGHNYYFSTKWDDDNISDKVSYIGNGKNDLYGYLYGWYNFYNQGTNSQNTLLNGIMTDILTSMGTKTWEDIKNDNPSIYNTLAIIDELVYTFFEGTDESNKNQRSLELYSYYRAGSVLFNNYGASSLTGAGLSKDVFDNLFYGYKHDQITGLLTNKNTNESQVINVIVIVNNRTLNQGELIVRDKDGDVVDKAVIDDPFVKTVDSIPSYINVNGETMRIVWKNVAIDAKGNLDKTSQTIYGNIKNSMGQEVKLDLYVNKWSFKGVYNQGTEILVNNFYFNNYIENSAVDSYVVWFEVQEAEFDINGEVIKDSSGKISTMSITKKIVFYPENSVMLGNTTSDSEMDTIKQRNNYVIYWDNVAKSSALNLQTSNVEGDLYLGNSRMGEISINSIKVSNVNISGKVRYNFEDMDIEKLKLVEVEDSYELYEQMKTSLLSQSGLASVVMNIDSTFPVTGSVKLRQNNISYEDKQITVRYLWNKTYTEAINDLERFIADSYRDVAENVRRQYALNMLMNFDTRTESENEEMYLLAKKYVAKNYYSRPENEGDTTYATKDTSGEYVAFSERCIKDANTLLMLDEKYNFVQNSARLKGGADRNQYVTVLVRLGNSENVFVQSLKVTVIFSDYLPIAYYEQNQPYTYTQIGGVSRNNLPSSLYIAVRTEYWDTINNMNKYQAINKTPPYDQMSNFGYQLLHYSNTKIDGIKLNSEVVNGISYNLRLKQVTNITYRIATNGLTAQSTAFTIDGVRYTSDLITLNIVAGG